MEILIWNEYDECTLAEPTTVRWKSPPAEVECAGGDIHLWRVPLDLQHAKLEAFAVILSSEEKKRADAFLLDRPRRQFIASHGALRNILARYLHIAPAQVQITAAEQGKPVLAQSQANGLHFNMAHAEDYALIAIAYQPIGVDLEYLRDAIEIQAIAQRIFSAEQIECLASAEPDNKRHLFFQYWTRMEAYLKALGIGFYDKTEFIPSQLKKTTLCCCFMPVPNYIAAVAIAEPCESIKYWAFE